MKRYIQTATSQSSWYFASGGLRLFFLEAGLKAVGSILYIPNDLTTWGLCWRIMSRGEGQDELCG